MNTSWSSTASQPPPRQVGRGTSVEYEDGAANASRRLQISKPGSSSRTRKPLSKNPSLTVPDSEGEEDQSTRIEREKSPFMDIVDTVKSAVGTATFFAKQRLMEPSEPPHEPVGGRESSYDYENEQREYENQSARRGKPPTHKRNRMSTDNRAYLPPIQSEAESDEDYESDGKTKKRKKKKKEPAGSMNNLPVIAPERRRKKKPKDKKGTAGEEDEASESDEEVRLFYFTIRFGKLSKLDLFTSTRVATARRVATSLPIAPVR